MHINGDDAAHVVNHCAVTTTTLTLYSLLLLMATANSGSVERQPDALPLALPQRQRPPSQNTYVESGTYTQRQQLQTQSQRYSSYGDVTGGVGDDDVLLNSRRRGNVERNDDVDADDQVGVGDDDDSSFPISSSNNQRQRQRQQQLLQQRLQRKQQLVRGGQGRAGGSAIEANKCRIWVPVETVDKYPYASRIQPDQRNQLQMIEVCCPGYGPMRWRGSTVCKPQCENCRNGFCIAPDECQCYEEFVANDNGDCVFTCPLGCLNGRCYLDGTCQCEPGYKLDETRKYCRPICSSGCGINPRHNCTEPEVCGCAKGYQLTDEGCQPTCEPDCGVGGECREPNLCHCAPGYTLKDNVCQRDCYQKCDNGICYSNNRCICNPGFTYHERSTQCVPK